MYISTTKNQQLHQKISPKNTKFVTQKIPKYFTKNHHICFQKLPKFSPKYFLKNHQIFLYIYIYPKFVDMVVQGESACLLYLQCTLPLYFHIDFVTSETLLKRAFTRRKQFALNFKTKYCILKDPLERIVPTPFNMSFNLLNMNMNHIEGYWLYYTFLVTNETS
jgi:hypothetical protein